MDSTLALRDLLSARVHVLVVGGTGFVGRRLDRELRRRGWRSTVLAAAPARLPSGSRIVVGDRRDPRVLDALAALGPFDAGIDLVAYEPQDSAQLLARLGASVGRLVHLSTVSVYRGSTSRRVSERSAIRWESDAEGYGARKAACERVVEAASAGAGPPAVIVRSAPLLGKHDPVSREGFLVRRLKAGQPVLVAGDPDARIVMLSVDDLAWTLAEACAHPGATGEAFHVAQLERLSFADHVRAIGDLLGVEPVLRPLAPESARAYGMNPYAFPHGPLGGDGWLDSGRAREVLGFRPAPYADALQETVAWLGGLDTDSIPCWPGRASPQSRLAGTNATLYEEAERLLLRGAVPPAAVAPAEVMDRLVGFSTAGTQRVRVATPPGWPRACAGSAEAPLEACLEPDPVVAGRAWLHCREVAGRAHGYRAANAPPAVVRIGFAGLADALDDPGRPWLLASWDGAADRSALRRWLVRAHEAGAVELPSAAHRANVWIERERSLALEGAAAGLGLPPSAGSWAGAFTAGRLLTTGGVLPHGRVTITVDAADRDAGVLVVGVPPAGRFAMQPDAPRVWRLGDGA